jgi:hypothetical protein
VDAVDEALAKLVADRNAAMLDVERLTSERDAWRDEAIDQSKQLALCVASEVKHTLKREKLRVILQIICDEYDKPVKDDLAFNGLIDLAKEALAKTETAKIVP